MGKLFNKPFSAVTVGDCEGIDSEALQEYIDENYVSLRIAMRQAEALADELTRVPYSDPLFTPLTR